MLELLTDTVIDLANSAARHGEGLFETIRVLDGVPQRLEAHLERLGQGAAYLGMAQPPGAEALRAFLGAHTACGALPGGILRLVAVDGRLQVTVSPWERDSSGPVGAGLSRQVTRFSGSPLNRFKTMSYLENRLLAKEAAQTGVFERVALNEAGRLTDGGRTSLFLARGGELLTPPVADGALPGIARRVLLEAGLAREAHLEPGDLEGAEGLLLTNALRGAVPVATWDGQALDAGHPLLVRAAELLGPS